MSKREEVKRQLALLIEEYKRNTQSISRKDITEETIRGYINKMLEIFGWNVLNTNEIIQEKKLTGIERERLKDIQSTHTKPDYRMTKGSTILAFLDAKDLNVDITKVDKSSNKIAFQIRSYGWSAQVPCSFVSNFEQFGIYRCDFKPNQSQLSNYGTILFTIDDYIDNFDLLYDYLNKESVYSGKLDELHNVDRDRGQNTLDKDFMQIISNFRLSLGENILKNNPELDVPEYTKVNYLIQLIMDRILFIKVCEARGIEKEGLLQDYLKGDFWKSFKESCYFDFYEHYDGAMFDRDKLFNDLKVDNQVLEEFVVHLYDPSPYKFDVIPVSLIAEIYEYFLAKKIEVEDGEVIEKWKGIYQKSQGAVSTPKYLVDFICSHTINLDRITSIEQLLSLRVLEPACGSGTFLVSAYSLLEQKMVDLFKEGNVDTERYMNWFIQEGELVYLNIEAKREIMKHCIFGIDIDETAIEVTKMSLALKVVDNNTPLVLDSVGVWIYVNISDTNKLNFYCAS